VWITKVGDTWSENDISIATQRVGDRRERFVAEKNRMPAALRSQLTSKANVDWGAPCSRGSFCLKRPHFRQKIDRSHKQESHSFDLS